MKRPDMDVMTHDQGLIGSINAERGPKAKGKIRKPMTNHNKRRWDTVGFIRYKLDAHLPDRPRVIWRYHPQYTKFLIGDVVAVSVCHSPDRGAKVDLLSLVKSKNKAASLGSKLEKEIDAFFIRWKPSSKKKGPARGKKWYKQQSGGRDNVDSLVSAGWK